MPNVPKTFQLSYVFGPSCIASQFLITNPTVVPFIDVGVDWIERTSDTSDEPINTDSSMEVDCEPIKVVESLHCFLDRTNWWVSRQSSHQVWDGHCAFIDRQPPSNHSNSLSKPTRIRSLRKKDLYAAWNSMMRTPRLVRRRLRRLGSRTSSSEIDATPPRLMPLLEESVGETVVWRRLMDQIADISYRADSKRLGDDNLHDLFGEFRHYVSLVVFQRVLSQMMSKVVEKYAYNNRANRFTGNDPTDVSILF